MSTREKFNINIIAAISKNNVIGLNNKIPWHIPEDLKRFKNITSKHTVIMGRKTYESIVRPLPNRFNIVLSNTLKTNVVKVCNNFESALSIVPKEETDVFIIGGQRLYEDAVNFADNMYITLVDAFVNGDTYFPKIIKSDWKITNKQEFAEYKFIDYKRV